MSVLALTTAERVKAYGEISGSRSGVDEILADMILSVSQRMEQYCSRLFLVQSRTERGTLRCDEFLCYQVPVSSIASVKYSSSGRGSDLIALPATQYEIAPFGFGIRIYDVPFGGMVEASYTGGLAVDTVDVIANHPSLEEACKMQVVNLWQRHKNPDKTGLTIGTGETTWTGEYSLLKEVKRALDQEYNLQQRII